MRRRPDAARRRATWTGSASRRRASRCAGSPTSTATAVSMRRFGRAPGAGCAGPCCTPRCGTRRGGRRQAGPRRARRGRAGRESVCADGFGPAIWRRPTDCTHRSGPPWGCPAGPGRRRWGIRGTSDRPVDRLVEVHWAPDTEAYVTPVADDCVGVAISVRPAAASTSTWRRFGALRERVRRPLPRPGPRRGTAAPKGTHPGSGPGAAGRRCGRLRRCAHR